jgi:hypothetical protein
LVGKSRAGSKPTRLFLLAGGKIVSCPPTVINEIDPPSFSGHTLSQEFGINFGNSDSTAEIAARKKNLLRKFSHARNDRR